MNPASIPPVATQDKLDAVYTLTQEQIALYDEYGFIKLKHVLAPDLLEHYRAVIHDRVAELSHDALPMEKCDTYGGITPWYADQYCWPVDSERTITAWVPLQRTPTEMGPPVFSEKGHRLQLGRDLEISDESEMTLKEALETFSVANSAYDLGDVSFHAGWTFPRAGTNATDKPREVMTVIYTDEHIRMTPPKNKNHIAGMGRWMPGLKAGDRLESLLNPVVYSTDPAPLSTPVVA